jgi:(4-alkanoyl-5-oxo-2,5-dihydrofuran-3-yl)methyl phosphate reductase
MILVTGATGNVGRPLVARLAAGGARVRALTRDPARADLPTDVEVVGADLGQPTTLAGVLDGVERVFLLAPTSQLASHTANLCAAARRAGVRHVVLLASSIVELGRHDELSTAHRQAEQMVARSGMGWTFLRPGAFMSNTLAWADAITTGKPVRLLAGNFAAAPIDPDDIAAVAFEALQSEAHIGAIYPLAGSQRITPGQQVAVLGELLGRPLTFEEVGEHDALAELMRTHRRRDAVALMGSLRRPDVPWARPLPTVERLTRRQPGTFRRWARAHLDAFQRPGAATRLAASPNPPSVRSSGR